MNASEGNKCQYNAITPTTGLLLPASGRKSGHDLLWFSHRMKCFWIKFGLSKVLEIFLCNCCCRNDNPIKRLWESLCCTLEYLATRTQLIVSTMPQDNSELVRLPRPVDECIKAASKSNGENPYDTWQSGSARADPERPQPFYLTPITWEPSGEYNSGGLAYSFPDRSNAEDLININMMPFVVGSSFKACRLPKYVRPYWDLILACIGPELNKEVEPWWPKTSDPSDLGKVSFLTFPFFKNLKSQSDCIRSRYISSQYKRVMSRQVKHKEGLESMLTLQEK